MSLRRGSGCAVRQFHKGMVLSGVTSNQFQRLEQKAGAVENPSLAITLLQHPAERILGNTFRMLPKFLIARRPSPAASMASMIWLVALGIASS